MNAASVKCPNCDTRVPIPSDLTEAGEKRVVCSNCGVNLRLQRKQPPAPASTGASTTQINALLIPGYRLIGRLGKGGMGSVFSGMQTSSNRLVAIKVLPPSSAAHPDLVLRFEREARTLASLTHPNIVQIIDRGRVGKLYYFVMEYIPGRTLKDRMDTEQLSLRDTLDIVTRVGEAMQHCHDHGLAHRDLKPSNILLTLSGEAKVTDFGIAGWLRRMGDITEQGVLIGTPQYVAPEQLRDGSRIDHRADQFSIAVLAYEMLTNCVPVGAFSPVSKHRTEVSPRVDAVLNRALARDPSDRYRSVREFIHEFRKAVQLCLTPTPLGRDGAPTVLPDSRLRTSASDDEQILMGGIVSDATPGAASTSPGDDGGKSPSKVLFPPARKRASLAEEIEPRVDVPSRTSPPVSHAGADSDFLDSVEMTTRPHSGNSGDMPPARRGFIGWWQGTQSPHRVAVLGAAILLLVVVASAVLRYWYSRRSLEPTIGLVDGRSVPTAVGNAIVSLPDLEQALGRETTSAFLLCTRAPSGRWDVASDWLGGEEMNGLLSRVRLHFVESSVAGRLNRLWRWKSGGGLVITANPPNGPPAMVMAVAAPLTPERLRRALHTALALGSGGGQNVVLLPSDGSLNLLANGDFKESLVSAIPDYGWNPIPGRAARVGSPASDPLRVASGTEAGVHAVALDAEGETRGIEQHFALSSGKEYSLKLRARNAGARTAWVDLVVSDMLFDSTRSAGELATASSAGQNHDRALDTTRCWALAVELERTWRDYEVRWVPRGSEGAPVGPYVTAALAIPPTSISPAAVRFNSNPPKKALINNPITGMKTTHGTKLK